MADGLDVDVLLDAADPHAEAGVRLDALRALAEGAAGRPVPAPRWRLLRTRIQAELRRRAVIEGRPSDAVFRSEIDAAIALAAPAAQLAAARAFTEAYRAELRRLVGDLLLDALLGDWRHPSESIDAVSELASDHDPVAVAHAERLIARLPKLAGLVGAEREALTAEISTGGGDGAQRASAHRARTKIRRASEK